MGGQRGRFGGAGRGMPREVKAEIARRLASGERYGEVAGAVGVSTRTIIRFVQAEGMPGPRRQDRSPRHLSTAEREEIRCGLERGDSFRQIAARLDRHPGTISREVNDNGGRDGYRAWKAEQRAEELAARPKPTVFDRTPRLAAYVEAKLALKWSPQEIAGRLLYDFPDGFRRHRHAPARLATLALRHHQGSLTVSTDDEPTLSAPDPRRRSGGEAGRAPPGRIEDPSTKLVTPSITIESGNGSSSRPPR